MRMFSWRSSFYGLFYCTVATCGSFFLPVIIIVGKKFSGIYSFDMLDPALELCLQILILKLLLKPTYSCSIREIALQFGQNSKITSLLNGEAVIC